MARPAAPDAGTAPARMKVVVVVAGSPQLVEALRAVASAAGDMLVSAVGTNDGVGLVQAHRDDLEALVLGAGVAGPLAALQGFHAVFDHFPILLLADASHVGALSRDLEVSPFARPEVGFVASDTEEVSAKLAIAIADYRRRQRHRSTLAGLDARIASVLRDRGTGR